MQNKIWFGIWVMAFIAGAFIIFNSYASSEFDPPTTGGLTWRGFSYILFPAGAFFSCYYLEKILEKGGGWILLGLPVVVLAASFFGFIFLYDWMVNRDIDKNGIPVSAIIQSTEFQWIDGTKHDHVYFKYTYSFPIGGTDYVFTKWQLLNEREMTSERNPIVSYDDFPKQRLFHEGDTLRLFVSSVNPDRQR